MSRIYDVVRKDRAIDIDEIPEYVNLSSEKPCVATERKVDPYTAVSRAPVAFRTITLRLPPSSTLFPFDDSRHLSAEQYRIARTKLLHHPNKPHVMIVSSACSQDGKTLTAINLAASFALKNDSAVLLVDADLRRPRVSDALGIPITPGLTDVITGRSDPEEAIVAVEQFPNLYILPAGGPVANPAELLDSDRFRSLVERLRRQFSTVICDTPPAGALADYELLETVCDGTILVLRPDHTETKAYAHAIEAISKEKLLGVLLNCVEDWWLWKTASYSYYRQYPVDAISNGNGQAAALTSTGASVTDRRQHDGGLSES